MGAGSRQPVSTEASPAGHRLTLVGDAEVTARFAAPKGKADPRLSAPFEV